MDHSYNQVVDTQKVECLKNKLKLDSLQFFKSESEGRDNENETSLGERYEKDSRGPLEVCKSDSPWSTR